MSVDPLNKYEYFYNKDVALKTQDCAKKLGLKSKIFYRDHTDIDGIGNDVNSWCGEANSCSIELHFNWFTENAAQGTLTLYEMNPIESIALAGMVQDSVCRVFDRIGKFNRGLGWVKLKDRGYYNLAVIDVPCCLVEPGFGSNHLDAKMMLERIDLYAEALAKTANEFLKKERDLNGKN